MARLGQPQPKGGLPQLRVVGPFAAEEAEMPVTAIQKILRGHLPHRLVIDVDQRYLEPRHGTRCVNHWFPQPEHGVGKLFGEQLSNQAVRLPRADGLNNGQLGRAVGAANPSCQWRRPEHPG